MDLYTIGFTQRGAKSFFGTLESIQAQCLIDVRLRNDSQLAGFTRKRDLPYFLDRILGAGYVHEVLLAPTADLLSDYRGGRMSWDEYELRFLNLLKTRRVDTELSPEMVRDRSVLLCSEPSPERCHRRLVAEYLSSAWGGIRIIHL